MDGRYGFFRQIAMIPFANRKPIAITIGRFEVTQILGWDAEEKQIFFIAAPELRPGQRHLHKVQLDFEVIESNFINIRPRLPVCLTCDNSIETFDMNRTYNFQHDDNHTEDLLLHLIKGSSRKDTGPRIPNNCLYNKIYLSVDYSYYVQECLGPDRPSVYLVDSATMRKKCIVNRGSELRANLLQLALPQIRTFDVEVCCFYRFMDHVYLKL